MVNTSTGYVSDWCSRDKIAAFPQLPGRVGDNNKVYNQGRIEQPKSIRPLYNLLMIHNTYFAHLVAVVGSEVLSIGPV